MECLAVEVGDHVVVVCLTALQDGAFTNDLLVPARTVLPSTLFERTHFSDFLLQIPEFFSEFLIYFLELEPTLNLVGNFWKCFPGVVQRR
mgnify:CR=1 FL=1